MYYIRVSYCRTGYLDWRFCNDIFSSLLVQITITSRIFLCVSYAIHSMASLPLLSASLMDLAIFSLKIPRIFINHKKTNSYIRSWTSLIGSSYGWSCSDSGQFEDLAWSQVLELDIGHVCFDLHWILCYQHTLIW